MEEIVLMAQGHPLWTETIALAEGCSWRAGPVLAERMRKKGFLAWERVCAARIGGEAAGFCTFCERDELPEGYPFTPFIGFVFVAEAYRGKRLSQRMIQAVTAYAGALGYGKIYIMSGETGLYEKYGFRKLGSYETIYGSTDQLFVKSTGQEGGTPL